MADRCAGCTNKFKFREKPAVCAKCNRNFCTLCIPRAPKHKKGAAPVRETCIYCSRRMQEAMKKQEVAVIENFPDRFYHSPHLQAPVVTKVRLNEEKMNQGGSGVGGQMSAPLLTEEDKKLEERLRRLKESHKPTTPAASDEGLKERLAKLRGEEDHQSKGVGGVRGAGGEGRVGGAGTETKQADNLVEQMSDRVRIERKNDPNSQPMEDSISSLLSGMEFKISDEDPNRVLDDLRAFQLKEEQSAMAGVASQDVQDVVAKARELHQNEQKESNEESINEDIITPYPQLPPALTVNSHDQKEKDEISETEISRVMALAQQEMKDEVRKEKEVDQFIKAASKQLDNIRGKEHETGDDDEVRSKLDGRKGTTATQSQIDFSWGHFGGGEPTSHPPGTSEGETAAKQLGITLGSDVILDGTTGTDSGDEAAGLLKQTLAETALDRRLEEKGLDRYLNQPKTGKVASSGDGACAAANPPSSSQAAASDWGGLDPNDLPWCCICNADAQIRCYDCDNDLYCTQCFSDGHEQFGLFDHKYAPFEPLISRAV